jgi:hypothetical protein
MRNERADLIDTAARDLARLALDYQQNSDLSVFALPEVMLLAAIELAASIDGTPEGTLDWLANVLDRLRGAR